MSKRNLLLGLVCGLVLFCMAAINVVLYSTHAPYYLLRTEADENASTLDLETEGDFAHKPAAAVQLSRLFYTHDTKPDLHYPTNAVSFMFCGGSAANKTFSYKIYVWRDTNGPAELLAYGAGTLGTQAVVKYPDTADTATSKFWADTLSITKQGVPKTFTLSDYEGDNRISKLSGDITGYEWVYCEITSADGATGDEAGDISVYISFF